MIVTELAKEKKKIRFKEWYLKNKSYNNDRRKEWRHKKGISKKYCPRGERVPNKFHRKANRAKLDYPGEISAKIVQMVYEDNIKIYGTLTCYLCQESIEFGKDTLEHRIPASRGGTNEYKNLGVAHSSCNNKKHQLTEEEFRERAF